MIEAGIVDPTKVTRSTLENAQGSSYDLLQKQLADIKKNAK